MNAPETESKRWFLQARDDFMFVEWVKSEGVFFDKACFIAQQAAEKALKACLYAQGKRRIFTHSIFEMIQEIAITEEKFKSGIHPARRLDRFYIPTRYPNGLPGGSPCQIYTAEDLSEAAADLKIIMEIASAYLVSRKIEI
jgi:HEPN domain-containing protein